MYGKSIPLHKLLLRVQLYMTLHFQLEYIWYNLKGHLSLHKRENLPLIWYVHSFSSKILSLAPHDMLIRALEGFMSLNRLYVPEFKTAMYNLNNENLVCTTTFEHWDQRVLLIQRC